MEINEEIATTKENQPVIKINEPENKQTLKLAKEMDKATDKKISASVKYNNSVNYRPKIVIEIGDDYYIVQGFAKGNKDNYAVSTRFFKRDPKTNQFSAKTISLRRGYDWQLMRDIRNEFKNNDDKMQVAKDFLNIYNNTGITYYDRNAHKYVFPMVTTKDTVLSNIYKLQAHYENKPAMMVLFSKLYLAMIAESRYVRTNYRTGKKSEAPSKLSKKVKMIGVTQALFNDKMSCHGIAYFSRGKNWQFLNKVAHTNYHKLVDYVKNNK